MILASMWWEGFSKPEWNEREAEIWNPYLKAVSDLIKESVKFDDLTRPFELRDNLKQKFGFAIPNKEAVETLRKYAPILEAGAGTGYWAEVLRRQGIDVLAIDNLSGKYSFWLDAAIAFEPYNGTQILNTDAIKEIPKHLERSLFLCWPDYHVSFAYDCVQAFTGKFICYVGEPYNGCTGDKAFHDLLESDFDFIHSIDIPQWWGLHDYLQVCERKTV